MRGLQKMNDNQRSNTLLTVSFLILVVYFSQIGLRLPDVAGVIMLMLYLLIGATCLISSFFMGKRPAFLSVAFIFIILLCAVWVGSDSVVSSTHLGKVPTSVILKNSITFLLSLFIGYVASKRGGESLKQMTVLTYILAFTCLLQFFIVWIVFAETQSGNAFFVNNSAYCFVTLLPYIYYISPQKKRTALLLTLFAFIFLALCHKRGALICFFIVIIYSGVQYLKDSRSKLRAFLYIILFIILCCILLILQVEYDPAASIRFMETLEGYSSGRDMIYGRILDAYFRETDNATLIFGNGLSQSVTITGNYAHSDWFELLADTGITGIIVYAAFFISYIFFIVRNGIYYARHELQTMNLIMLLLFVMSVYSMGFTAIFNAFDMLLLGFIIGQGFRRR